MSVAHVVLDLRDPGGWPAELQATLSELRPTFHAWFTGAPGRRAGDYDAAHERLHDALQPYALRGWHLSRLLGHEFDDVRANGLRPLSRELLEQRVTAAEAAGLIDGPTAAVLKSRHQAGQSNRAGRLWFGFYEPLPDEDAIAPLLLHWGGEALYWAHADDPTVGPVLRQLGRPTIIDATVPIASLREHSDLENVVARSDLAHAGLMPATIERLESCAMAPVPAGQIEAITSWPSPEFVARTRCNEWDEPLR